MLQVAAIQMVSAASVAVNLARAGVLLQEAARQGAELAVLPENFSFMGHADTDKLAVAEAAGEGPIQDFLARTARELGLWVVAGTVPLRCADRGRVRSSALVYSPRGVCAARYDKVHLFWFSQGEEKYNEPRTVEAGRQPVSFDLVTRGGEPWRIGLSICYDLRFPELYRALRADLLLVPSAFTFPTGQAHWDVLLRARAVENLAYVAAPAQGGLHENGRRTWGHSLIADPWGTVLVERQADGEGLVVAALDRTRLEAVRTQLPALTHRVL